MSLLLCSVACAGLASCKDLFTNCSKTPYVVGLGTGGVLWVGESLQLTATADREPNDFCNESDVIATSTTEPANFAYTSDDTTIVSVNATGLIRARASGTARLKASYNGNFGAASGPLQITVTPVVAVIAIVQAPANPRVGDTLVFTSSALDSAGAQISGVLEWTLQAAPANANIIATTATTLRMVATHQGDVTVSIRANHLKGPILTGTATAHISP
jgi:hypothetical protein